MFVILDLEEFFYLLRNIFDDVIFKLLSAKYRMRTFFILKIFKVKEINKNPFAIFKCLIALFYKLL